MAGVVPTPGVPNTPVADGTPRQGGGDRRGEDMVGAVGTGVTVGTGTVTIGLSPGMPSSVESSGIVPAVLEPGDPRVDPSVGELEPAP
jgi:hypothetical protein